MHTLVIVNQLLVDFGELVVRLARLFIIMEGIHRFLHIKGNDKCNNNSIRVTNVYKLPLVKLHLKIVILL